MTSLCALHVVTSSLVIINTRRDDVTTDKINAILFTVLWLFSIADEMTSPRDPRWQDIFLNVDLLTVVPVYISYVDRWRAYYACCTEVAFMRRVIDRYERYWLPLLADWSSRQDVEPPLDVHWIWQHHLLRPLDYGTYCQERFGRMLPHRLHRYPKDAAVCAQLTATLWRDSNLQPGEPFDVDLEALRRSGTSSSSAGGRERKLDYLIDVVRQEQDFVYQVNCTFSLFGIK